jgi:hypothetical protein
MCGCGDTKISRCTRWTHFTVTSDVPGYCFLQSSLSISGPEEQWTVGPTPTPLEIAAARKVCSKYGRIRESPVAPFRGHSALVHFSVAKLLHMFALAAIIPVPAKASQGAAFLFLLLRVCSQFSDLLLRRGAAVAECAVQHRLDGLPLLTQRCSSPPPPWCWLLAASFFALAAASCFCSGRCADSYAAVMYAKSTSDPAGCGLRQRGRACIAPPPCSLRRVVRRASASAFSLADPRRARAGCCPIRRCRRMLPVWPCGCACA